MIGFSKLSDYRLSDYKLSDFLVENTWPFKPIAFEESVIFVINNGNRTEWTPIRSLIIRVINKIRRQSVLFNHEYDYRPNWTRQSPVTTLS